MFFGTHAPVISGGAATIMGQRFDQERVLVAYERLIDMLTGRIGGGKSVLTSHRDDLKGPFSWPHPAKGKALRVWRGLGENYDVLGEGFTHVIGPITAKAYVLGRGWAVYDCGTHALTTPQGRDVSALDTAPVVELYGRDLPRGDRRGMDVALAELVQRTVRVDLSRYGLICTLVAVEAVPGRTEVMVSVRFSSSSYGAGQDWIRVRCVAPDGKELGTIGYSH